VSETPPGERQHPTLAELAKVPGKCNPRRVHDLEQILMWGNKDNAVWPEALPTAVIRIAELTRAYLEQAGISLEEAQDYEYAYRTEAEYFPQRNAYPRSQLMLAVVRLLSSSDPEATGLSCCMDIIEHYKEPPPPPMPERGLRLRS
jgi:hypothetical protein